MNAYKIKYWIYFFAGILFMVSCKEDTSYREPTGDDTEAPGLIQVLEVENLPGKAKITYVLPADENLLYVKAVYTLTSGKEMEIKSSYYADSIVVEGFADTLQHEIKLYSVSRREVASAATSVMVTPKKAPIWNVLKSVQVINAFGGYNLIAMNPRKMPVAVLVMQKNVFGEWAVDNNLSSYTSVDTIRSKKRGLDTLIHDYAIAIRDRWGNLTDTLPVSVKPLYATELSRSKFSDHVLPGDVAGNNNGGHSAHHMWDGNLDLGSYWNAWFSNEQAPDLSAPTLVTIDLGVKEKLSSVVIFPYKEWNNGGIYYYYTTMKRFEIWGSANPNPNGALDGSWMLLRSCTLVKPSGLPVGTENADDLATAAAGFEWDLDINAPPIKYLRLRCLENFGTGGTTGTVQSVAEIHVYGDPRTIE